MIVQSNLDGEISQLNIVWYGPGIWTPESICFGTVTIIHTRRSILSWMAFLISLNLNKWNGN